jgi:hypothetical protein
VVEVAVRDDQTSDRTSLRLGRLAEVARGRGCEPTVDDDRAAVSEAGETRVSDPRSGVRGDRCPGTVADLLDAVVVGAQPSIASLSVRT